ncbi:IMPACT family protein [Anaerobranca californiensis]|nr:YigZ family protein [Anaerobranca californiensis]
MLKKYYCLKEMGIEEIIINKSRFISLATPIESEEQAKEIIEKVRKEHMAATHNVYAYIWGENDQIQRCSDDGEPSGTAGKPVLEVIKKENLKKHISYSYKVFWRDKIRQWWPYQSICPKC